MSEISIYWTLEDVLDYFEGCLIEPINNSGHPEEEKRKVIEIDAGPENPRWIGYGKTYADALFSAFKQATEYKGE